MRMNDRFKPMKHLVYPYCVAVLFSILGLGVASADELPVPLVGVWKATASTDDGDKHYTITISKGEDALGGTIVEDGKEEERNLDRVNVDGKKVAIEIDVESGGQTGIVKVLAEMSEDGTLTGEWSITDTAGTPLMGGEWEGAKENSVLLSGKWDAVAELADGGTLESVLSITGKPGEYEGEFRSERGTRKAKKLTDADESVTIELAVEREGASMDIRIESKVDGADLVGTWYLLDAAGDEVAEGDWKAVKRVEFVLVGSWNVVAILPGGDELSATFDIAKEDDALMGRANIDGNGIDLKSVEIGDEGAVEITFGYEADGTAGLVTVEAKTEGNDALEGKWLFVSSDGSENLEGDLSASRVSVKRGVLRGR